MNMGQGAGIGVLVQCCMECNTFLRDIFKTGENLLTAGRNKLLLILVILS